MNSIIEIAVYTTIGLSILFAVKFIVTETINNKTKIKDFFNNLGEDVQIDFTNMKVEGYENFKSTYAQTHTSALITQENCTLISNFIPIYYENEKWFLRLLRIVVDRNQKKNNLENSLLYYLYCNGFRMGYNEIESQIEIKDFNTLDQCSRAITRFNKKINASKLATGPTLSWNYYKLLGKSEGAKVRGKLFANEKSTNTLSGYLQVDEKLKNALLVKIKNYFLVKRKGKSVAVFIKAMWINTYLIPRADSNESIYKALEDEIGYELSSKGERSAINKHLNPYSDHKILNEATILSEQLKI